MLTLSPQNKPNVCTVLLNVRVLQNLSSLHPLYSLLPVPIHGDSYSKLSRDAIFTVKKTSVSVETFQVSFRVLSYFKN